MITMKVQVSPSILLLHSRLRSFDHPYVSNSFLKYLLHEEESPQKKSRDLGSHRIYCDWNYSLAEFTLRYSDSGTVSGIWWRHMVAGGVAGAVSRTSTAPLDRIKLYMQAHGYQGLRIADCFNRLLKEGGIMSFWRGNGINILKIVPESAIKFWAYEQSKRMIRRAAHPSHSPNTAVPELNLYKRFVAGAIAGAVSQSVVYPLEVLKTRFALRKTGDHGTIVKAVSHIYKTEGIKCFYRGSVPNFIGILPYAGIDLAVYETLKNKYLKNHQTEEPSTYLLLACGIVSSTCAQMCGYPLALVRTRLQTQIVDAQDKPKDTMSSIFKEIIKAEGLRGLYRGLMPNFMKTAPSVSITYVVYEKTRMALGVEMC